jgi:hypothetical protein
MTTERNSVHGDQASRREMDSGTARPRLTADDELDRLEAVMYIRTLYLACFGYRRALTNGRTFHQWGFIEPPEYFSSTAAATRAAFRGGS